MTFLLLKKLSRLALMTMAAATSLGALSGCGFSPVHSQTAGLNSGSTFGNYGFGLGDISINVISDGSVQNDKIVFLLRQALRDRIGDQKNTPYVLRVTPTSNRAGLGISGDDVASRYDLVLNSKYKLVEIKTNKTIAADSIQTISTYGASRDPYGAVTAGNTAQEHVTQLAADRILRQLALHSK